MVAVQEILQQQIVDLKDELSTLELACDEKMVSDMEYNYKKHEINAKIDEVNAIYRKMMNEGYIRTDEAEKDGHLIGANGDLRLYLKHGQDSLLWLESNGVQTMCVLCPRASDVMKWKLILGIS